MSPRLSLSARSWKKAFRGTRNRAAEMPAAISRALKTGEAMETAARAAQLAAISTPPATETFIRMWRRQITEARMPPSTVPPLIQAISTAPTELKSSPPPEISLAIWIVISMTVPPKNQK